MNKQSRGLFVFFCFCTLLCITLSPVFAQSASFSVNIISIDSDSFPKVKAYVSISDVQGFPITGLDSTVLKLSEDNQPIANFSVSPFKNTEQSLAIVLAMDTSGSMAGTPIINSNEAAKSFISTLMSSDQVSVVSFSTAPVILQEITTDRDKINQALDSIKAEGDTALYDAIIESTNILKNRSERKVIVLLTDGKETGISQFSFDQAINEAVRWSAPIYPIGFGGGVDKNELERLAKLTGGFAQINPDSTTLSNAFQNILDNLREQYLVEYTSNLQADGLEHDLNIAVEYQNGTASANSKIFARPGAVSLSLPEYPDASEISGRVLFKPDVLAPAPLSRVDILIDNQPLTSILASPYEYLWDSSAISLGEHVFNFIATDTAGNSGSLEISLFIIPPVSVTTGILPDQVVGEIFPISAEIEAPAGIAKVEFIVDGNQIAEVLNPPYEIEWDTTKISPGFHELLVRAADLNGFSGEEQVRVNVNIQKTSNLIWVAFIVVLVASAVIIPLAVRRNKRKKISPTAMPGGKKSQQSGKISACLIEKEGINPGQKWNLFENDIHIGRKKEENDIPLKGLKASRRQGIISLKPEGYILISINPENPMIVNGSPAPGELLLVNGDLIQAGESEFVFEMQTNE